MTRSNVRKCHLYCGHELANNLTLYPNRGEKGAGTGFFMSASQANSDFPVGTDRDIIVYGLHFTMASVGNMDIQMQDMSGNVLGRYWCSTAQPGPQVYFGDAGVRFEGGVRFVVPITGFIAFTLFYDIVS